MDLTSVPVEEDLLAMAAPVQVSFVNFMSASLIPAQRY